MVENSSRDLGSRNLIIQLLRAVAVGAVLAFHLWPSIFGGGFIGVDIFFVISGYLVCAMIIEKLASKSFSLLDFYLRRARRLFPAAVIVIFITYVVANEFGPIGLKSRWTEDAISSLFGFSNWLFVSRASDYFAFNSTTGPFQHFWSLSVETQIYLFWPILLLLVARFAQRFSEKSRFVFVIAVAVGTLLSAIWSALVSATNPNLAYLDTVGRFWEFGVGALLYFAMNSNRPVRKARWIHIAVAQAIAIALILSSVFVTRESGGFPFPAAIPAIVGTAISILSSRDVSSSFLMRFRILRWGVAIGNYSYGVYLWHWPLLVLLPYVFTIDLNLFSRLAIVGASVVLGAASYLLIELPSSQFVARTTNGSAKFIATWGGAGIILGAIFCSTILIASTSQQAAIEKLRLLEKMNYSCRIMELRENLEQNCGTSKTLFPSMSVAFEDELLRSRGLSENCQMDFAEPGTRTCEFGDLRSANLIVVAGDSHAAQWLAAIDAIGRAHNVKVMTYLRSGCPLNIAGAAGYFGDTSNCAYWVQDVIDKINLQHPSLVITSASVATGYPQETPGEILDAYRRSLRSFDTELIPHVVVIRDTPNPKLGGITDVPTCLQRFEPAQCTFSKQAALPDDLLARSAGTIGMHVVDFTGEICPGKECPVIDGTTLIYRDGSHITQSYALTFTLSLWRELSAIQAPQ